MFRRSLLACFAVLATVHCAAADPRPAVSRGPPVAPPAAASTAAPAKVKAGAFLSDSDPGYREIERLQVEAYTHDPRIRHRQAIRGKEIEKLIAEVDPECGGYRAAEVPGNTEEERRRLRDAKCAEYRRWVADVRAVGLTTRYENPCWRLQIVRLVEQIERTLREQNVVVPERVVFGTVPTHSINAFTYSVGGERVVLLQEDLFDSSYSLTKAILQFQGWDKRPPAADLASMRARIQAHPEIRERFERSLLWYVGLSRDPMYALTPEQDQLHGALIQGMEFFVIAHELSHAILKHRPPPGGNHAAQQVWSWRQELEADGLGFALTYATLQREAVKPTYDPVPRPLYRSAGPWGPELLLTASDLLARADVAILHRRQLPPRGSDPEEIAAAKGVFACMHSETSSDCKAYLGGDPRGPLTHPPAWVRRLVLRSEMQRIPELAKFAQADDDVTSNLAILAYEQADPILRRLVEKGAVAK